MTRGADQRSGRDRLIPRRDARAAAPEARSRVRPSARPVTARSRSRAGVAAILIVGTGIAWILLTALGDGYGWPNRTRALFDLFALAGFGVALYLLARATWARRAPPE